MRTIGQGPRSLRVYPNDELQVVLKESDPLFDDMCFRRDLLLDEDAVSIHAIQLMEGPRALVTLHPSPGDTPPETPLEVTMNWPSIVPIPSTPVNEINGNTAVRPIRCWGHPPLPGSGSRPRGSGSVDG